MPKETITSTTVIDDHTYLRSLHVAWGAKGGRPEAPDGWVNAGFAQVQISEDHGTTGNLVGLNLNPEEIDHLIRTLKRVRRQAFRRDQPRRAMSRAELILAVGDAKSMLGVSEEIAAKIDERMKNRRNRTV